MNCHVCATPLPPGVSYCPNCGTPTTAFYSSGAAAPDAATVASSPESVPMPPPPTNYGPQPSPYGEISPSPYSTPPATPYDPYRAALLTPPPPPPERRSNRIGLLVGVGLLVLVLVVGGVLALLLRAGSQRGLSTATPTIAPAQVTAMAQAHATSTVTSSLTATAQVNATATAAVIAANPDPYPPGVGTLALYDPLSDNSKGYNWDTGSTANGACTFSGEAYRANTTKTQFFYFCVANSSTFSNFAFETQVKILKGDCGGLIFRADSNNGKLYLFEVCQDGSYNLYLYRDLNGNSNLLANGSPSAITRGQNQSNVLAVMAQGNTLVLYVNKQRITSVSDSTYSHGEIGLVADAFNNLTEVVFSNAKVWTL